MLATLFSKIEDGFDKNKLEKSRIVPKNACFKIIRIV